jgi:hypothetical protein
MRYAGAARDRRRRFVAEVLTQLAGNWPAWPCPTTKQLSLLHLIQLFSARVLTLRRQIHVCATVASTSRSKIRSVSIAGCEPPVP